MNFKMLDVGIEGRRPESKGVQGVGTPTLDAKRLIFSYRKISGMGFDAVISHCAFEILPMQRHCVFEDDTGTQMTKSRHLINVEELW